MQDFCNSMSNRERGKKSALYHTKNTSKGWRKFSLLSLLLWVVGEIGFSCSPLTIEACVLQLWVGVDNEEEELGFGMNESSGMFLFYLKCFCHQYNQPCHCIICLYNPSSFSAFGGIRGLQNWRHVYRNGEWVLVHAYTQQFVVLSSGGLHIRITLTNKTVYPL